ncbi:MAG: CPBP family intramembrane metalloprotease [Bdellovibrionales bacterium]|nr:CPBP family intramembrane metalloprotease [Bdellovibrionales bacterium]
MSPKSQHIGLIAPYIALLLFALLFHEKVQSYISLPESTIFRILNSPQTFFLIFSLILIWIKKISPSAFGLGKVQARIFLPPLWIGLLPILLVIGFTYICEGFTFTWLPKTLRESLRMIQNLPISELCLLLLLAPIAEEFFFRGVLLRAFAEKKSWRWASLISSIVFALTHSDLWMGPFALGMVNAYLLQRTQSLYPLMLLHFLVNCWGILAMNLPNKSLHWIEMLFR